MPDIESALKEVKEAAVALEGLLEGQAPPPEAPPAEAPLAEPPAVAPVEPQVRKTFAEAMAPLKALHDAKRSAKPERNPIHK